MIFELACSPTAVQFWSDVRLPFEPKGEARRARDELRRALRNLTPTGELVAEYCSTDRRLCDVENVLLYNVGVAQFTTLSSKRIKVVRSFDVPPLTPSGRALPHLHRYGLWQQGLSAWRRGRLVGERVFVIPAPFRTSTVWAVARALAATSEVESDSRELEVDVDITLPATSSLGLASLMKPLLDGVVASFHCHDGSGDLDLLAGRLAGQLGAGTPEVKRLLLKGPAALDARPLVRRFGEGVQWNPADDRLVAVEIRMTKGGTEMPRCCARLYEVTA